MTRGRTERETCELNGWTVGTRLVGDEGYGPTIITITAIGETRLLATATRVRNGRLCHDGESTWTLTCREWVETI